MCLLLCLTRMVNPSYLTNAYSLPCLGASQYTFHGTRIYFRLCGHKLGGSESRPGVSRKTTFVVRSSHSNIQKKPLEGKGVNTIIYPFSSQGEILVHKSISKKHTNRYLRPTEPLGLRDGWRAAKYERTRYFPLDRFVGKTLMKGLWRTCLCMDSQVYAPGKPLI